MVRTKFYQSDAIKVYFRLRRKPLYYLFNVAIPVIILSAMTLLVFCMPPEADEKMGYVVTVFLSYTVFTSQISNSVPVSSEAAPLLGRSTPN
jgi:nicotinic acetylcholine receptor